MEKKWTRIFCNEQKFKRQFTPIYSLIRHEIMPTIAHSANMPQERRREQDNSIFMNMLSSILNHQSMS